MFWIIFAILFIIALVFWTVFVGIVWTHRPIPMWEIIQEIIKELREGSGKERK